MNFRELSLALSVCALGVSACGEEGVQDNQVGRSQQALSSPELDVLFVIDDSGSMASKQQKLAREVPRMVRALATGDLYADKSVPPGVTPEERFFKPVRSLHMGVVSTNLGGLTDVVSTQEALLSCSDHGLDGKLRNGTSFAEQGVIVRQNEVLGALGGETIIAPEPTCALGTLPLYQTFEVGVEASATALAFGCTARLGIRGCPFEQPLEAMWKALAPNRSGELFTFSEGTRGQGELHNAGFLREHAALAVILLTDEDDCSVSDAGRALFSLSQGDEDTYGPLNLRCAKRDTDTTLVRSTQRYVDGLRSLKPGHPERVKFAAITGVPMHAQGTGAQADDLLAMPGMAYAENPNLPGVLSAVCSNATGDEAYPARRIVNAAKAFGANAFVASICDESYEHVVDALLRDVAPLMGPAE